jgi:hypothetical protein
VRAAKTWVVLQLTPVGEFETRLVLAHLGWQAGPEWDRAYGYFQRSWSLVLTRLDECLRHGPLDWGKLGGPASG